MTTIKDIYRQFSVNNVTVPDTGRFDHYFHYLRHAVLECVEKSLWEKELNIPLITPSLQQSLEDQFRKIALRSLILEMNVCHRLGELSGNTQEEKYHSFVTSCLLNQEWLTQFTEDYPLLHRYLSQTMQNAVVHLTEAIERFYIDRDQINQRFFSENPCTSISEVEGTGSDGHKGGKSVLIFYLDNGENLVYKPRSLAVDCGYQEMVSWIAEGIGISYRWNKTWDRGEYGWSEWVPGADCETMEQLKDYYHRNGILLAVSYLLGSGDIHLENLIANGEYPIIIDLEMGVGYRDCLGTVMCNPAERLYLDSVIRTGLLPTYAWNEDGEGGNVGAISATGNTQVPLELPVVVQPGTVNMHIEYMRPTMKGGKNLATLQGKFIEPERFVSEIEDGFERAHQFIVAYRTEVMERVEQFAEVSVRFLANPTQIYSMIINSSYLPQYVRDETLREEALAQVGAGREQTAENAWITAQEIGEMRQGDVPYFWFQPGEKRLCSGTGEAYEDYFSETAIEQIAHRLSNMDSANMRQQMRLIRTSLVTGEQAKQTEPVRAEEWIDVDEDSALAVAEMIGDLMLEDAVWGEHRENVGWLGMMFAGVRETGYLIRPMGPYLYDGWAGVALFMTALAKRTGNHEFAEVATKLKHQLFSHTDEFSANPMKGKRCTGAYTGEASVAYAYQLLYVMGEDDRYLEYMEKQCETLPRLFEGDQNYDVLGGNAGAILVLLNAYALTGKQNYLDWAAQAGDCLIRGATTYEWGLGWRNPAAKTALTGFAHGAAGMVLALAKLSVYSKDDKYREATKEAFRFEQHFYREEKRDWLDLRSAEKHDSLSGSSTAWCHGWGGILTAYRLAAESLQAANLKEAEGAVWERKLELIPARINPRNRYRRVEQSYSLCHGKFGNAALLYGMGERQLAKERYMETVGELICEPEEFRGRLGVRECENYGLMGGMAGIGMACVWELEDVLKLLCLEV